MAQSGALLAVNNIEVIYNHVVLVLKGVSLEVSEGGIVSLLGGNGAGKTTTLKAISNLLRAERGEVHRGVSTAAGIRLAVSIAQDQDRRFARDTRNFARDKFVENKIAEHANGLARERTHYIEQAGQINRNVLGRA